MKNIFAEVRTGEDRRNMQLESQGLRIRDGIRILKKGEKDNTAPVLREEILDNPDAVFLITAGINAQRDENGSWTRCPEQIERFGRRVSQLVFRKGTVKGGRTFIHPNMVGGLSKSQPAAYNHGGIVHPYFTVGLIEALRGMDNTNIGVGVRGGLRHPQVVESGLDDLFKAHNIPFIEAHTQYFKDYRRSELVWHECPEGIVQKRFCTYKPVYQKGTTYINIAHAHTHPAGHTTLSVKNNQGVMPRGYGHICDDWTSLSLWRADLMDDFNREYRPVIEQFYIRHANMGYKHWDQGDYYKKYIAQGGYPAFTEAYKIYKKTKRGTDERRMALEKLYEIADHRLFMTEIWAQRMMDIIEVLPAPYISMVEGVFGRGSDCGIVHPDFLTVSRSMFALDKVTSWLMGHDPRELPYLRIAAERGLGGADIENIPIYILDEKGIQRVKDYRYLRRHPMGIRIYNLKELGSQYF